ELPQTLSIFHPTFQSEAESPFTLNSTPTYVDESPNVFNPPPQSLIYPCEFCGNDAYYGYYCTPQAPFIYPKPCYNQDFNFPQDFQDVPQQYTCCDDCRNSLNDSPNISETSSQSPLNINHCCYECGDPLDGIFCKRCTCKSCGKDAHIGYNCPSNVPVISNPEPCNNQTIDELPQTLLIFHLTFQSEAESPFTLDSTPTYVDESPNVFNPPPQSLVYPCEFCRNDAYYGYYCTPQAPFIYLKPCYNQDFNFPQDFQDVPQQYTCCDDCRVTHDAYQSIYRNHPIFNAHNDLLISQTMLNEQMTQLKSMCEIFCQSVQKKRKEKRIEEEQAAKAQTWKLPVCYDDDDDEERSDSLDDNIISGLPPFSAITPDEPVLSTKEPDNSLSMGDEHLDTIPTTESDQFIKSGVENLIPIPSESEGIPEHMCDVPFHDNSPPLDVSTDQIPDFSNDDQSSSDEDILKKIVLKPLSEEEIIPMDSLRTIDSSLLISSKIDSLLDEFAGELTLLKSIPPGIDATDLNLSPSPILVKDNDSLMEEIDFFCTLDYPMPPGIMDKDYDSERDILIRKDLPSNNSISFAKKESVHFDIPSFSRPPTKPPDGDTRILNIKMMGDIFDQKAFMHKLMITLASH
nr:hypothetical protein [Tanacetum cinerariifolium]